MDTIKAVDMISRSISKIRGVSSILDAISVMGDAYNIQDRENTCDILQGALTEAEDMLRQSLEALKR